MSLPKTPVAFECMKKVFESIVLEEKDFMVPYKDCAEKNKASNNVAAMAASNAATNNPSGLPSGTNRYIWKIIVHNEEMYNKAMDDLNALGYEDFWVRLGQKPNGFRRADSHCTFPRALEVYDRYTSSTYQRQFDSVINEDILDVRGIPYPSWKASQAFRTALINWPAVHSPQCIPIPSNSIESINVKIESSFEPECKCEGLSAFGHNSDCAWKKWKDGGS